VCSSDLMAPGLDRMSVEKQSGLLKEHLLDSVAGEPLLRAIKSIEENLQANPLDTLLVSGLHGGATALMLSAWHHQARRSGIVVTGDRESADRLADDLEAWLGADAVVHLPQQEVLAFDHNSPEPAMVGDFITGLDRLKTGGTQIVVTSISGLRQKVMAPGTLERATIRLKCGQRIEMDDLCLRLSERGYRPAGMVAKVGDFARRGGLLDVFMPGNEPLRIEFFDDEIVSVRRFDVESQRTTARGDEAAILPVSHLLLDDDAVLNCLSKVEEAASDPQQNVDPDFIHDLEARLEDRLSDDGLEAYLPWLGPVASVADYLPAGAAIFWLDPVRLKEQSELLDGEIPRLRDGRLDREPVLPSVEDLVTPATALNMSRLQHAFVTGAWISGDESGRWLDRDPQNQVILATTGQDLRGAEVAKLRTSLLSREADSQTVLLLCEDRKSVV